MLYMPNWAEITALCAGFALMGGIFMFATRSVVRDEIRRSLLHIDETYLRREVAQSKFEEIEKHFDFLRDKAKHTHGD